MITFFCVLLPNEPQAHNTAGLLLLTLPERSTLILADLYNDRIRAGTCLGLSYAEYYSYNTD